MEFSPSKYQVMQVTGSKKPIKFKCSRDSHLCQIPGVDVSSGLTWNSHIDRITGNAKKTGLSKTQYQNKDVKDQGNSLQHHRETAVGVRFSCMGSPYKGQSKPN